MAFVGIPTETALALALGLALGIVQTGACFLGGASWLLLRRLPK